MKYETSMIRNAPITSVRALLVSLFAGAVFITPNLGAKGTTGEPGNGCMETAVDALAGCKASAQSTYSTALGKCVNFADPKARRSCERQAAADLQEARDTCEGAFEVRKTACGKFGPEPYDPEIDPANFVTKVDNPYFPLLPGTTFTYLSQDHASKDVFAVTHNTRVIDRVTCVEVHDSVYTNDELTEDTLDWFAQDKEGNVWYFGENTAEFEDGLLATIEGSFMAGANNDKPGIIMKAQPEVGDFYRQEFSLNNAEDNAETVDLNAKVTVPYGTFPHSLKSVETTPLESDAMENKYYAPGVGNVLTVDLETGERDELVSITTE